MLNNNCIIAFASVTWAMKAQDALAKMRIPSAVLRLPTCGQPIGDLLAAKKANGSPPTVRPTCKDAPESSPAGAKRAAHAAAAAPRAMGCSWGIELDCRSLRPAVAALEHSAIPYSLLGGSP